MWKWYDLHCECMLQVNLHLRPPDVVRVCPKWIPQQQVQWCFWSTMFTFVSRYIWLTSIKVYWLWSTLIQSNETQWNQNSFNYINRHRMPKLVFWASAFGLFASILAGWILVTSTLAFLPNTCLFKFVYINTCVSSNGADSANAQFCGPGPGSGDHALRRLHLKRWLIV